MSDLNLQGSNLSRLVVAALEVSREIEQAEIAYQDTIVFIARAKEDASDTVDVIIPKVCEAEKQLLLIKRLKRDHEMIVSVALAYCSGRTDE